MNNLSKYSPFVLRLGLAGVFIWFGLSQILNQTMWVSLIPSFVVQVSGLSATTLVVCNGIFEVVLAICLAFGIQIRIAAFLLCLHLFTIVIDVGLGPIGIRDVGLMFGMLTVFLNGKDSFAWGMWNRPDETSSL